MNTLSDISVRTDAASLTPHTVHPTPLTSPVGTQARLASLMAALIGVPFPRNAVETLPLEYLDIPAGSPLPHSATFSVEMPLLQNRTVR